MAIAASDVLLTGRVAVVTGGGAGIGRAIAAGLTAFGASVAIWERDPVSCQESAEAIGALGILADVRETESVDAALARTAAELGPVTILVNNAGVHLKKLATETSDAEFANVLQTHVFGAFALTREAGRRMVERRHGCVLFTASMASLMGIPQVVAYSAAKSAYLGLVRALATEWGAHGVRVNAIAPGWVASDMLDQAMRGDPARKAKIIGRTPLARFGEPDDIGWAAVYLASPAAKFVTGVVLPVDGGAAIGF